MFPCLCVSMLREIKSRLQCIDIYDEDCTMIMMKGQDSKRTWFYFPLFSFFEQNIDGRVPNEFSLPFSLEQIKNHITRLIKVGGQQVSGKQGRLLIFSGGVGLSPSWQKKNFPLDCLQGICSILIKTMSSLRVENVLAKFGSL